MVLTVRRPIIVTRKSKAKFEPKWEGPYVVTKVFTKGAYELSNADGDCIYPCVNGKFVKKVLRLLKVAGLINRKGGPGKS